MKVGLEEFNNKIEKIRKLINVQECSGVLFKRQSNFSWLTGGRGHIGLATELSCAQILVTPSSVHLLVNEIEAPRLRDEEIPDDLGIQLHSVPWFEDAVLGKVAEDLVGVGPALLLSDDQLAGEIRELRTSLSPQEMSRYRELGRSAAMALERVCKNIRGGESEFELAGKVSDALWANGIDPITVLVAVDDRTTKYRHLIPTEKRLKRYVMLSICARKWGLIVSATRLVHLGLPPADLRNRLEANLKIDAAFISLTRPGKMYSDIFQETARLYAEAGYPDEWKKHHQGGLTGYMAREIRVNPDSRQIVETNQAFAWNPTITGVKCEDTIIVHDEGNEVITHTGDFTYQDVEFRGDKLSLPALLILR